MERKKKMLTCPDIPVIKAIFGGRDLYFSASTIAFIECLLQKQFSNASTFIFIALSNTIKYYKPAGIEKSLVGYESTNPHENYSQTK